MSNCSDHKNPLHNNGTSQPQRLLPGLDRTEFALVDEKDFADWIVFANEFGRFINYYPQTNTVAGNWQPFFAEDISARLGVVAIQDIDRYKLEIEQRLNFIKDSDNAASLQEVGVQLNELFSAVLTLSKALDNYLLKLPEEASLRGTIGNLVKTKLAGALKNLIAYYKAAANAPLNYIEVSSLSNWLILNQPLTSAAQIIDTDGLSADWFDNNLFADWQSYVNSITPEDSIFQNPLTGISDKYLSVEHAANHNLFSGIFDTFLSAYAKIIKEAESELLKTLENYDQHTPHYALFLSFLKLFRFTQTHINSITQRHLDFYYKEVLRLQPRPAEANKVHVLGELAKQVDSYLLVKDTELKAGKDSLKKEVNYALDSDVVFNKATVTQLKTFYKAQNSDSVFEPGIALATQNNTGRVFASPISNSDNGLDPELTSANKEWHPFVHKVYKDAQLENIAMPKAELGFAVASHYLFLTEGERKVFIRFVLNNNSALNGKKLKGYLTTEKDWYKIDTLTIASAGKKLSDSSANCAEISFTIPGSAPAIVNYDAAKHGGNFKVNLPILKLYLINEDDSIFEYDGLKDITLTKVEIRVEVGNDAVYNQNGLKNLLLSNDFGNIDPSKPFMPFGSQPVPGNRITIGNKEIFSKKNVALSLNLEWKNVPAVPADISFADLGGSSFPNISINKLTAGIWKVLRSPDEIFESPGGVVSKNRRINLSTGSFNESVSEYEKEYSSYDIKSTKGFIALQLTQSFGHKEYLVTFSDYLVKKANNISTDDIALPVEPYTPVLQSLYAGYSAYCIHNVDNQSNFENRELKFFHLYPFGEAEQHKYLNPSETIFLLPQFKHKSEGITKDHIGEFYIGIENLDPGEGVNILFQVMEGTTNPTLTKPADHIHWSYLGNNSWLEFENSEISDNTLNLVQSGIISFAIPNDATTENTLLPPGFIWLKASVTEAPEAVCELLSVNAQAASATFINNNNAPDFLDNALSAGTISKLKIPDSSVKKIIQPYVSFGGRPKEDEDHFYIRVSERLRHKERAITVWDYEHLVLEAFPEIYKVKCLNHTQIEDGVYHEVRPGYVSIITIPSQVNQNTSNPLKPYTQQDTLTKIENFLRKRISCFVNLHAAQPQFEEVRLEFSLKLYEEYKDFTFYANQLREEITQYLSPWAYGNTSKIDFGGKVHKSVLINFIEERYYVDFITDVNMYVKVNETTNESGDKDEIVASTARSILVSTPAVKHSIHEITLEDSEIIETCIDKNND